MIEDGFCDDETNNEDCRFDGGDCCGYCANQDHCLDCTCHVASPLNPGCHGKYKTFIEINKWSEYLQ